MSLRFRSLVAVTAVALAAGGSAWYASRRSLRVCADPNNLPFSNAREEGFENRLAHLVARDLHATVRYTWWAQRRGFIRNTLNAQSCDVILGVPSTLDMVLTTTPYYRSTYVFVTRRDRHLTIRSLDDSALRRLVVGVQLIGDDGANSPPAHALARRGIVNNVRGFTVYGDYSAESPPSRIIDAVAEGDVDVAIAWGPMAGYWARQASVPLALTPVTPEIELPFMPNVFDISMGVRRRDTTRRAELERILVRRRAEIAGILDAYGIPRLRLATGAAP